MNEKLPSQSRRSFLATGAAVVAASGAGVATQSAQSAEPRGATVSTYADALNRVGRNPMSLSMTPDVKPLTSGGGTIIGPAVTTKWQADNTRMTADEVRKFMFEPLDQASPGSIWVVAGGTDQMLSLFGGVIGIACKRNGMLGAVTDNACRDVADFEAAGFPVFGKTTVPYGPGMFARPVAANVAVDCGGVEVRPGDYVAADIDGVIVIPGDVYEDVMVEVSGILAKEQQVLDKIDAGVSLAEAYTI
jgi:4-hydroxy-4-methyl-2-oxoglutarate aldolase